VAGAGAAVSLIGAQAAASSKTSGMSE
jgi:hypothetical protein